MIAYDKDDDYYLEREEDQPCTHCKGRGYLTVEADGGGPAYHCPDCDEREEDCDE